MTRWRGAVRRGALPGAAQPVTTRTILERRLAVLGLGDRFDDFNTLVRVRTSVGLEQRVPQEWARNVRVPTFLYQVRGDILTDPSDVQAMFNTIPVAEKKLHWIEGTTARWDGYLEFQRRPRLPGAHGRGPRPAFQVSARHSQRVSWPLPVLPPPLLGGPEDHARDRGLVDIRHARWPTRHRRASS